MAHSKSEDIRPATCTLVLIGLLIFLILAGKSPDAISNPQLWAEDGTVFFAQQFGHALPQVFTTYAGYLHLIPRLIAWIATAFSYNAEPLIYNFAALCIDSAAILYFARRSQFLAPIWLTIAAFALTPTNGEIFGTLTNIQWFLQFALFAVALYPRPVESVRHRLFYLATAAMALTGPFSIFLALITACVFVLAEINRHTTIRTLSIFSTWWTQLDKPVLGIIAASALIQLIVIGFIGSRVPTGPFSLNVAKHLVLSGFQIHAFGVILMKESVAFIVFFALLWAVVRSTWQASAMVWPIMLAMLAFGLAQIVSSAHVSPNAHLAYTTFDSDRYFTFAKVAFWICLAAALRYSQAWNHSDPLMLVPLLVLFAICHPQNLRRPSLPDLHWKQAVQVLKHPSTAGQVTIPINPAPWSITVKPQQAIEK